ncbi:MAG: stage II sporulation protein E [Clostridiaceae bacterium]
MQYGLDVDTYKRIDKGKKQINEKVYYSPVKILLILLAGILVSRVLLNLNISDVDKITPFGVAYLMAFLGTKDRIYKIVGAAGVLAGYMTIMRMVKDFNMYVIVICVLTVVSMIHLKRETRGDKAKNIILLYITIFIYKYFLTGNEIVFSIMIASSLTMIIGASSYIIRYSLECIGEFNTEHLFSKEELISVIILTALAVTGIGRVGLFNISLRNVMALTIVILTAYMSEVSLGAATGIVLGVIIGMTTGNMPFYVSLFGICGLITGIFKEMGRVFAVSAFLIVYLLLNIYCENFNLYSQIEGIAAVGIFLLIPKFVFDKLGLEFNPERKENKYIQLHFMKIREEFNKRLRHFTDVLEDISYALNGFDNNDKLLLKSTSSALIENLGDRVCSNCDMKYMCWKRELYSTYVSFSELIKSAEEGNVIFPADLEKKCVKKNRLIKNTQEIVENHVLNAMWKKRMGDGRKIIASHIENMAKTVEHMLVDLDKGIEINHEWEKNIKRMFSKNNIKFYDVFCYEDKSSRINVKLTLEDCKGNRNCVKRILPILNDVIGKSMRIGEEGCQINPKNKQCTVIIEETPKYYVDSYVQASCKEGEEYTGDSYYFGSTKDGIYMTIVSDGMGSGPSAGTESKMAVELIEKFTSAGFGEEVAIRAVNSIMHMKFAEDEKYATLDMNTIDLYSGEIKFIKIGAAASFIKSNNKVEEINSKTLPFGVLEEPDVEIIERKLKNGDVVITISDGILELDKAEGGNTGWLVNYLRETKTAKPKDITEEILKKIKEITGGKYNDDMTIIVSKVYTLY